MTYLLALGAVLLGVGAMVAGELDDAPGLFGLGLLIVLGAIGYAVRSARRGRQPEV